MKKLKGVIVAITTPFNDKEAIDLHALKKLTEHLVCSGVDCLYVAGTTGECQYLNENERKILAETVVEHANKRVTVYIQAGANSTGETIRLAKHAQDIGADGIGCLTPSYFKVNDAEMIEHYCAVSNSLRDDFPMYLYNIPVLSGNDLTPETVQKISGRCKNIQGIKYSISDVRRLCKYMRINNGKFSVLQGSDDISWPSYTSGVDGIVTGSASILPELFIDLDRAWKERDIERCLVLNPLVEELVWLIDGRISAIKAILQYIGICPNDRMRRPLVELSSEEKSYLFEKYGKIVSDYKNI